MKNELLQESKVESFEPVLSELVVDDGSVIALPVSCLAFRVF